MDIRRSFLPLARMCEIQQEIKVTDGQLDGPAARWLREEGERKKTGGDGLSYVRSIRYKRPAVSFPVHDLGHRRYSVGNKSMWLS
jgi:hypothetical protein